MQDYKKITQEVYDIVMTLNDPEFGLDWMSLKKHLHKYFKEVKSE